MARDLYHAGVNAHRLPGQQAGDLPVAMDTNHILRLIKGAEGDLLQMVGGLPSWVPASVLGDGLPAGATNGDVLQWLAGVASWQPQVAGLPAIGAENEILQVIGGVASWESPPATELPGGAVNNDVLQWIGGVASWEPQVAGLPAGSVNGDVLQWIGGVASWETAKIASPRGILVAASNARAATIAQADYVCDGAGDHTEINAAIVVAALTRSRVILSEGTFTLNARIFMGAAANYVGLYGQGPERTTIKCSATFGSLAIIALTNLITDLPAAQYLTIEGMTIDGADAPVGKGLGITGNADCCILRDLVIQNTNDYAINAKFGWSHTGSVVRDVHWGVCAENITLKDCGLETPRNAWDCGVYRSVIKGVRSYGAGNAGIWFNPMIDSVCEDCIADDNTGNGFALEAVTASRNAVFRNCVSRNNGEHGFSCISQVDGLEILDGAYTGNGFNGISLSQTGSPVMSNWRIIGAKVVNNGAGAGAATVVNGIYVNNAGVNGVITGCPINDTRAGASRTQQRGVYINDSAARISVQGNVFENHATAHIVDSSSNAGTNVKRDNIGHVTEASGAGAIASGATTAVVTHGLSVTPTLAKIRLTMLELPTNAPRMVWPSAPTATQFTINTDADPGVSGLDVGWSYAE